MQYIDPVLSNGLFGNLRNTELPFSGTITERPTSPPAPPPDVAAPGPFPWWLIVFGIFAVLALSEPQRG